MSESQDKHWSSLLRGGVNKSCKHIDFVYVENPESPAIGDGYVGVTCIYCPLCGSQLDAC